MLQHTNTKKKHVGWTECPCVGHTKNKTRSQQLGKVTLDLYNERITLIQKRKINAENTYEYATGRSLLMNLNNN